MSFFLEHGKELAELRLSRRKFPGLAALATVVGILFRTAMAVLSDFQEVERSLAFYNTHTGEGLKVIYWAQGEGRVRLW